MPNMNHLKALGLTIEQWVKLTEDEKIKATNEARQIISDSHPAVSITYKTKKKIKEEKEPDEEDQAGGN